MKSASLPVVLKSCSLESRVCIHQTRSHEEAESDRTGSGVYGTTQ